MKIAVFGGTGLVGSPALEGCEGGLLFISSPLEGRCVENVVAASDFGRITARAFEIPEARYRRFVVHGPPETTLEGWLGA